MTQAGEPDPTTAAIREDHQVIADVIRAAHRYEIEAEGSERRRAYRVTRHLLGGAIRSGVPAATVAEALGVTRDSLRNRSHVDGIIPPEIFASLAAVPYADLQAWLSARQVEVLGPDPTGTAGYRASDLLSTLVRHDARPRSQRTDESADLFKPDQAEPGPARYSKSPGLLPNRSGKR